jgi:hypothetical protein
LYSFHYNKPFHFLSNSSTVILDLQIFDNGRTWVTKNKIGSGDNAIRLAVAECRDDARVRRVATSIRSVTHRVHHANWVGCTAVVGVIDDDALAAGASQRFGLPLASKRFFDRGWDQSLAVVVDLQIFDNGRTWVTKK